MTRLAILFLAAATFVLPATAQDIPYDGSAPLQLPRDTFMGQAMGVATDSRGHVFVYTRNGDPDMALGGSRAFARGGSSLYEFAPDGKFIRQIGKEVYGILAAQGLRVDDQDNVWAVDAYSSMVMKFAPDGTVAMLLGRKPESVDVPAQPDRGRQKPGAPEASGMTSDLFEMPTDVAFDKAGNIFVADGLGNARIAKFTKDGVFVKSWGSRGTAPGQFASPRAIQVDADGNVYVADQGNGRIQIFDNDGNFKRAITGVGEPAALCLTKGAHPVLFSSNSNPASDFDHGGEIVKLSLDGQVLGRFGRAGKPLKFFGGVNGIDCRGDGTLWLAESANWRVQKVTLR